MKKLLCVFTSLLLFHTETHADEGLRDVQTELKARGFYFGEINGKESPETTAAIRRFQIRNCLEVTGKLNATTIDALGRTSKGNPTPAPAPATPSADPTPATPIPPAPAPVVTPPAPPAAKPTTQPKPANTAAKALRLRLSSKVANTDPEEYKTFFFGTPYANAPKQIQAETVRRAQDILVQGNFLRSAEGGVPDGTTADAVFAYQNERQLKRTGRLDNATLSALGLIPQAQSSKAPLKPFYETFKKEP